MVPPYTTMMVVYHSGFRVHRQLYANLGHTLTRVTHVNSMTECRTARMNDSNE